MSFRQLGDAGLVVSVAGLGCNTFGATLAPQDVPALVAAALDAGITFFDTADVYGGDARARARSCSGDALAGHRDDVVLATKFGAGRPRAERAGRGARGSRRYVRRAVEGSLRAAAAPTTSTCTRCTRPTP